MKVFIRKKKRPAPVEDAEAVRFALFRFHALLGRCIHKNCPDGGYCVPLWLLIVETRNLTRTLGLRLEFRLQCSTSHKVYQLRILAH